MKTVRYTLTLLLLFTSIPLFGARYYVKSNGNDDNTGESWRTALKTLDAAFLKIENNNDEIWVAEGEYQISMALYPSHICKVYGGFSGNESNVNSRIKGKRSIIRGAINSNSAMNSAIDLSVLEHYPYRYNGSTMGLPSAFSSFSGIIDGFLFKDFNNVFSTMNGLNIENCDFIRCLSLISSSAGTGTIKMLNCTVKNCGYSSSSHDNAIINASLDIYIEKCAFSEIGSRVIQLGSSMGTSIGATSSLIEDSSFTRCTNGAIEINMNAIVRNCTIANNEAPIGAGIKISSCAQEVLLVHNSFVNNVATPTALYSSNGAVSMNYERITGGAIAIEYLDSTVIDSSQIYIINTIFSGNKCEANNEKVVGYYYSGTHSSVTSFVPNIYIFGSVLQEDSSFEEMNSMYNIIVDSNTSWTNLNITQPFFISESSKIEQCLQEKNIFTGNAVSSDWLWDTFGKDVVIPSVDIAGKIRNESNIEPGASQNLSYSGNEISDITATKTEISKNEKVNISIADANASTYVWLCDDRNSGFFKEIARTTTSTCESLGWGVYKVIAYNNGCIQSDSITIKSPRIYVSKNGNDSNSGTSWNSAKKTVQSAIDNCFMNEVWIASGEYIPEEISADEHRGFSSYMSYQKTYKHYEMKSNVALYGGFAGNETTLEQRNIESAPTIFSWANTDSTSSMNSNTIVYVPNGTINFKMDGLTFKTNIQENTYYNYSLYVENSKIEMYNCAFDSNYFPLQITSSLVDISNSTIKNSFSGISINDLSIINLRNCIFSGNTILNTGGGLFDVSSSDLIASNCIFYNNIGDYVIYSTSSDENLISITNCAFIGNSAVLNSWSPSTYGRNLVSISNTILYNNLDENGTEDYQLQGDISLNYCSTSSDWLNYIISNSSISLGRGNISTDIAFSEDEVLSAETPFDTNSGLYKTGATQSMLDEIGVKANVPDADINGVVRTGSPSIGPWDIDVSSFSNYDKGMLSLASHEMLEAHNYFKNAINENPSDQKARAMYAITTIGMVLEDKDIATLIANSGGILHSTGIYNFDVEYSFPEDKIDFKKDWNLKEDTEYLKNKLLPELKNAYAEISKINDTSISIKFPKNVFNFAGMNIDVNNHLFVDYADIMLIKSVLAGAIGSIYETMNFNVDAYPSAVHQLSSLTAQNLIAMYSNSLIPAMSGNTKNAREWILTAITSYLDASYAISQRTSNDNCMFVLPEKDKEIESKICENLRLIRDSIKDQSAIFDLNGNKFKADISKVFVEGFDVVNKIPYFAGDKIIINAIEDITFGGILPDMTASKMSTIFANMGKDYNVYCGERKETSIAYSLPLLNYNIKGIEAFAVAGDGSSIIIQTSESLLKEDTNKVSDIYLLKDGKILLISTSADGKNLLKGARITSVNSITEDGKKVIFISNDFAFSDSNETPMNKTITINQSFATDSTHSIKLENIDIKDVSNFEFKIKFSPISYYNYYYLRDCFLIMSSGERISVYPTNLTSGEFSFKKSKSELSSNDTIITGFEFKIWTYGYNTGQLNMESISIESFVNSCAIIKDLETGEIQKLTPTTNCEASAISPDGNIVFLAKTNVDSSGNSRTVPTLLNLNTKKEFPLSISFYSYGKVKFSDDSLYLMCASQKINTQTGDISSVSGNGSILDIGTNAILYSDYSKGCIMIQQNGEEKSVKLDSLHLITEGILLPDENSAIIFTHQKIIYVNFATSTHSTMFDVIKNEYGYKILRNYSKILKDPITGDLKCYMLTNPSYYIDGINLELNTLFVMGITPKPTAYMKNPYLTLSEGVSSISVPISQTSNLSEKIEMTLIAECLTNKSEKIIKKVSISGKETVVDIAIPLTSEEHAWGNLYSVSLHDNTGKRSVLYAPACAVLVSKIAKSGFEAWKDSYFTEDEKKDSNISGENADPDGDTLANAYEYAMGSSPKDASSRYIPKVFLSNSNKIGITYIYNPNSKLTIHFQYSTDLKNWYDFTKEVDVSEKTMANGLIERTITNDIEVNEKIFIRLKNVSSN